MCLSKDALALKPANLTLDQAATVPVSAFTALQGLRDKGRIQPGHKVLIVNGQPGPCSSIRPARPAVVVALDIADDLVQMVRGITNKDKLRHLAPRG